MKGNPPPYVRAAKAGNVIAEAIRRLGGPTQAVVATGMSATAWDRWRRQQMITDVKTLLLVAELTGIDPMRLGRPPAGFQAPPVKRRKKGDSRTCRAAPPRAARQPPKAHRGRPPSAPVPATA